MQKVRTAMSLLIVLGLLGPTQSVVIAADSVVPVSPDSFTSEALGLSSIAFPHRQPREIRQAARIRKQLFTHLLNKQKKLLRAGLFRGSQHITIKEKVDGEDVERQASLEFGFANLSKKLLQQGIDAFFAAEDRLNKKKLLPPHHAEKLKELKKAREEFLRSFVLPLLTYTPMSLFARSSKKIVGFVISVIGSVDSFDEIPRTWLDISQWQRVTTLHKKTRVLFDIWFGGGGVGEIADAMLNASLMVAALFRCDYLIAYSNPRTLPLRPDLTHEQYVARVMARIIFAEIANAPEPFEPLSFSELTSKVQALVQTHAREGFEKTMPSLIMEELLAYYRERKEERPILFYHSEIATLSEDKKFFQIDPAITTHLNKGAKLAFIIPNAFPDIGDGPGIGAGYAILMIYTVPPLRDLVPVWVLPQKHFLHWGTHARRTAA